ncbi:hypothetical protein Q8W40_06805 [Vibrio penaeicida]|uniref:hypothetical protein n=1 Tax=Vibrio penaeicida TaxID=104609 RepID=UPI002734A6DE|nr:hypothetical protein [Vibrio penaeicida]MDP2571881.1 hypothetical protein [Vibrio penaeicida]
MNKTIKYSAITISLITVLGCTYKEQDITNVNNGLTASGAITVYVSNDLITLADNTPKGSNAVAVQDGKILDVGLKKNLVNKYQAHPGFSINDDFADKVITPGFVEPHIHLWLSGYKLPRNWKTACAPAGKMIIRW